jgi:hypothetical protein
MDSVLLSICMAKQPTDDARRWSEGSEEPVMVLGKNDIVEHIHQGQDRFLLQAMPAIL